MSAAPKMTPWFVNGEKPVRKGVYQQRNGLGELGYQRWDGRLWMGWCATAARAKHEWWPAAEHCQGDPWRGLARKP